MDTLAIIFYLLAIKVVYIVYVLCALASLYFIVGVRGKEIRRTAILCGVIMGLVTIVEILAVVLF